MNKYTEIQSFFGSLVAAIAGWTINDWAALFGIFFGLITVLINWHYKEKDDRRKDQELLLQRRETDMKEKALRHQIDLQGLKK